MNDLTLADLCVLIPILEKELAEIHGDIESDDDNISNDAAELSAPYGNTASKLERLYRELWDEGSNYPSYEELIDRA